MALDEMETDTQRETSNKARDWKQSAATAFRGCLEKWTQTLTKARTAGEPESSQSTDETRSHRINAFLIPFEAYFISLQSLLFWDKPYASAVAFISFNIIYWLIVSWSRRFYSILCLITLFVSVLTFWRNTVWPEIRVPPSPEEDSEGWTPVHPQALSAPEISHYMNEGWDMLNSSLNWLINLRKTNHGNFCFLVSSVFLITAAVGRVIPGVVIVYIIMMTVALGPGVGLYVVPSGWFSHIRDFLRGPEDRNDEGHHEEEPHYPCGSFSQDLSSGLSSSVDPFSGGDSPRIRASPPKTLDQELGIREGSQCGSDRMEENPHLDHRRDSSPTSDNSSNDINFVSTHYSSNGNNGLSSESDEDLLGDDFEIVSEAEIREQHLPTSCSAQPEETTNL